MHRVAIAPEYSSVKFVFNRLDLRIFRKRFIKFIQEFINLDIQYTILIYFKRFSKDGPIPFPLFLNRQDNKGYSDIFLPHRYRYSATSRVYW